MEKLTKNCQELFDLLSERVIVIGLKSWLSTYKSKEMGYAFQGACTNMENFIYNKHRSICDEIGNEVEKTVIKVIVSKHMEELVFHYLNERIKENNIYNYKN